MQTCLVSRSDVNQVSKPVHGVLQLSPYLTIRASFHFLSLSSQVNGERGEELAFHLPHPICKLKVLKNV